MAQKITMIIGLDYVPGRGDRVSCNGNLYKGAGTVTAVRFDGELSPNGNGGNEAYPQVVVKGDNFHGKETSYIRYNADDLLAGKLSPLGEPNAQPADDEDVDHEPEMELKSMTEAAYALRGAIGDALDLFVDTVEGLED